MVEVYKYLVKSLETFYAGQAGESANHIRRYVRLNELIRTLLDMVGDKKTDLTHAMAQ